MPALPIIYVVWLLLSAALLLCGCRRPPEIDFRGPTAEWPHWGGTAGGVRFSTLTQITPANVQKLRVAWTHRMGAPPADRKAGWFLEVTPILAEGRLYLCTPLNQVVALDPESGRRLWSYDPKLDRRQVTTHFNCRGVSFYRDPTAVAGEACAARIFTGTLDGRLIALDAINGSPCPHFGVQGTVDLLHDLGQVRLGEYNVTSPPTVVADQVIVGGHIADVVRVNVPAGVVRAYDARTGALSWAWNALPPGHTDAERAPPGEKYARGTPNAWSILSADVDRGFIFIPTGSPTSDLYGPGRGALDYYGSSVVALDAQTGRLVWHFQAVHHDLWDYDVASQPVLIDFPTTQGRVPAVVQATKQGHIYILNRENGEPLIPIEERPVPQSGAVPGETLAPTQPFPTNPAYVFHPGAFTEKDVWGLTAWDRGRCRKKLHGLLNEGLYTPPSLTGSVVFPLASMISWGGVAVDPSRDILVTNTMRVAGMLRLIPAGEADERIAKGEAIFRIEGSPYAGQSELLSSPLGAPCNPPPWGTLAAIDLKAGRRLWEIPLGTTRDQAPFPFWFELGVPNVGGPIVTASGLTFVAATTDRFIRAFETTTGRKLWQARLPAGGQAVPMTYRLRPDSKQYLVIAAGGHEFLGTELGDYLVAYSL